LGWFPSRKIRLFPNSADIRFHFPVHELVDPSVKSAGLTVIESDIPVHHYGCLNEGKANQKAEAYFRLGYSKLDRLGDDVAALRELAVQAGQLGYWPEALELWQRLLTLRPDYAEAYVNMAAAYWQTGKYQQSLESAQRACHLAPQMKEAAYNLAVSLLMLGNAERAADVLTELLGTHGDYLAAHFMLASASGCAGDTDRSIRLYRQLKQMPVGEALEAAIADLQQRLRGGGLNPYADALDLAKRRM
jgi:tetratricopeptide (TPR) repeat protein